ncbi:hypothetical protein BT93_L5247 [Corymbia citriodora subsp. variegata]|uniref:Histidine-rich glycoprotein-like n=1 Tax=Corymbia citriodora subsp. variegata TaxID=360336 RepID=A0A8T0CV12_CORYI|nr:hypothetical protein BT93_L5247 [Corymbia citriodora subsp. variegata]
MSSRHLLLLILSLVALAAPALAEFALPPEHGKHRPHHHGAIPPAWAPHHGHWPHHRPGAPGLRPELLEKPFPGHHHHHHPPADAPFPHHGHHPAHAPFPHHGHHHGAHPPMESGKGPHKPHVPRAPAPGHPY